MFMKFFRLFARSCLNESPTEQEQSRHFKIVESDGGSSAVHVAEGFLSDFSADACHLSFFLFSSFNF